MKKIEAVFSGVGILAGLAIICLIIGAASLSIYGVYLAFSASIILGIITLFVQPSPLVFGVCAAFGKNVPEIIQAWANFPI